MGTGAGGIRKSWKMADGIDTSVTFQGGFPEESFRVLIENVTGLLPYNSTFRCHTKFSPRKENLEKKTSKNRTHPRSGWSLYTVFLKRTIEHMYCTHVNYPKPQNYRQLFSADLMQVSYDLVINVKAFDCS